MAGFGVMPAELQACGAMLARLSEEVRAELKAVGSEVDGLLSGGWRGQAADGFAQGWEDWQIGAHEVLNALATMSHLPDTSGGNYDASDGAAKGSVEQVGKGCVSRYSIDLAQLAHVIDQLTRALASIFHSDRMVIFDGWPAGIAPAGSPRSVYVDLHITGCMSSRWLC
jgi:WXG100 family type VII secretion target